MSPRRAGTAALVLTGLAGCGSTGPSASQTAATGRAAALAVRSFAVFRRPARPGDEIPVDQANGGVRPMISRLAYAGPLGTVFAYVHDGLLCVSYSTRVAANGSGSASGGCDSVGGAVAAGVAAPIAASLDRLDRIALFLPDGVGQVTVIRAGGTRSTLRVRDNAIVYAGTGLRAWSFATRGGVRHTGALSVAKAGPARGGTPAGAASAQGQPTVSPARGTPATAFAVGLVARADLGPHQGLTTRYRVRLDGRSGAAPAAGCGAAAAPVVDQGRRGGHLTLTLRPGAGGWCRGDYRGTVLLESAPTCSGARACPPPSQSVAVGRFTFQVG